MTDTRSPLDPTRKFSEGGGVEHRWALGIDCPVCPAKAGEWCPLTGAMTWNVHGARVKEGRDPTRLHAKIEQMERSAIALAKAGRQALASAAIVVSTHSRDWSRDRSDAWLYGIIVGWEGDTESRIAGEGDESAALRELAAKFGWSEEHVERLRSLRRAVVAIIEAGKP